MRSCVCEMWQEGAAVCRLSQIRTGFTQGQRHVYVTAAFGRETGEPVLVLILCLVLFYIFFSCVVAADRLCVDA